MTEPHPQLLVEFAGHFGVLFLLASVMFCVGYLFGSYKASSRACRDWSRLRDSADRRREDLIRGGKIKDVRDV